MAREVEDFVGFAFAFFLACAGVAIVFAAFVEARRLELAPCEHATAADCERPSPDVMTCLCPRDAGAP